MTALKQGWTATYPRIAFLQSQLDGPGATAGWLRRVSNALSDLCDVRIGSASSVIEWGRTGVIDSLQVGDGQLDGVPLGACRVVDFASAQVARPSTADFVIVPTRWALRSRLRRGKHLDRHAVVPFCASAREPLPTAPANHAVTVGAVRRMAASRTFRQALQQASVAGYRVREYDGSDPTFIEEVDVVFLDGQQEDRWLVVEALARGRPCVVRGQHAQGEVAELVGPGGFVADGAVLAARLLELCSDESLRIKLIAKALDLARSRYAPEACAKEVLAIHKSLLEGSESYKSSLLAYGALDLGFFHAGPLEPGISYYTVTGGVPEEFEVMLFAALARSLRTTLDIGANTGLYCFVAAQEGPAEAQIWAFEPQPECCVLLRAAVALNNWEGRVHVVPLALGLQSGRLTLHLSGSGSSFDEAFLGHADLPHASVPVETLDQAMRSLGIPPVDLMKIDVEGFEFNVLIGAERMVERYKPIILVEIAEHITSRSYRNPNYRAILVWLERHGYRVWRCRDGRLEAASRDPLDGVAMYLCIHRKDVARWRIPLQRAIWGYRLRIWQNRLRRAARVVGLNAYEY